MELKEGMFVRIKNEAGYSAIGKIENINDYREPNMKYCIDIQADDFVFIPEDMIVKANEELPALLDRGDFLDTHCIVEIKNRTFFLNDGWFISFDDVEDLVYSIVTKEQFESIGYKVDEKAC